MATDITLEKNLPHNLEAERSVLGSILIENQAINRAQEILRQSDFYRDTHRKIYGVMETLSERATAIDEITLKEELARLGELDSVGGPAYIASLADGVPSSHHVEYYARIVKEKAVLRQLITSAGEILTDCYRAEEDVGDIMDRAESSIFRIAQDTLTVGFLPIRAIADASLRIIEELSEKRSLVTGLETCYPRLDELTAGLQRSDLIVVAARPAMGKTTFCLNVAQNAALRGKKRVGIFSLEMSREQVFLRMLCSLARIDAHLLRTGRLSKEQWRKLTDAFAVLSSAPLFIDDSAGIGVLEMRAKARRLKSEHGLDLLIIDYLQLIRGRMRAENRTQEISEISRSLKELAKELQLPVIAISQLSRAPETRGGDRRPQLSDLRESGAIEQDADVVLFIFREEVYKPTEDNRGKAQLIIGKQRNGPIGIVDLVFIKEYTKFEESAGRQE
ncbi:MAG TPA: replicative DNA helicase [Candidatus Polarisedimenticolia bacterium]|nr:replicative DNA helicase [Candidatus Polarisedimenticolia bacterium]